MVRRNPSAAALYVAVDRGTEGSVKALHTRRLPSDHVPRPWGGESATSISALRIVGGLIVTEKDKQEERQAQHVGKDGRNV